jgi:hypothetical protein
MAIVPAKLPPAVFARTKTMADILDAEWWSLPSGARMQLEGNLILFLLTDAN